MFPDIHTKTLEIVRVYVKEKGLWRVSEEEGFSLLREMVAELSGVYGIPIPSLMKNSYNHYLVPSEAIGLPKVSLVSALHEYRHHMQKYGRQRYSDKEVDARGWSISVFHLALPEDFDSAWRRGLIWFMPPHPS